MKPKFTKPTSLSDKLREFYKRNPREMLTLEDIMAKYDVSETEAKWAVLYLRRTKVVKTMQVVVKEPA